MTKEFILIFLIQILSTQIWNLVIAVDSRDKDPRNVDLKQLRQMSIDAYMDGGGDVSHQYFKVPCISHGVYRNFSEWAALYSRGDYTRNTLQNLQCYQ